MVALGGLTGCTDIINLRRSDTALQAQGVLPDTIELLQACKKAWMDVFYTLAEAQREKNKQLVQQLVAKVQEAKQTSIQAFSALDGKQLSQELNQHLQGNYYDRARILNFSKAFEEEFYLAALPQWQAVREESYKIVRNANRWEEAKSDILKEGGLIKHVRQEVEHIDPSAFSAIIQSNDHPVQAQSHASSTCQVALIACSAATASAATICALNPDECDTATAWAAAVCAAMCIACHCGGGAGGSVFEP